MTTSGQQHNLQLDIKLSSKQTSTTLLSRPVNHLVAPPLKRPLLHGLCDRNVLNYDIML